MKIYSIIIDSSSSLCSLLLFSIISVDYNVHNAFGGGLTMDENREANKCTCVEVPVLCDLAGQPRKFLTCGHMGPLIFAISNLIRVVFSCCVV